MVLGTYKEAVAARSTDKRIQEVAQDGGIASALLIYALENNIIELNCNIIRANINTGSIRNKYQKEVLVNIAMIDLYLDLILDINVINKKKFISSIRMLNEIRKMTNSWIVNEKN